MKNYLDLIYYRNLFLDKLFFFLAWFLLLCFNCFAQSSSNKNIHYTLKKEVFTIFQNGNYLVESNFEGICKAKTSNTIYTFYGAFDSIIQNQIYFEKDGNLIELDKKRTYSGLVNRNLKTKGLNVLASNLPPQAQNQYYFNKISKKKSTRIDLFPFLDLGEENECDSFYYEIRVPKEFDLAYKVAGDKSLLDTLIININNIQDSVVYSFSARYKQKNSLWKKTCYKTKKPNLKIVIVPEKYADHPINYISGNILNRLKNAGELSTETILFFDDILKGEEFTKNKVEKIFNYLQEKVDLQQMNEEFWHYEIQNVNEILKNGSATKLDLCNLFYQLLNHYGIKANLAFAADIRKNEKIDFPSMQSFSHVLVLINVKNDLEKAFYFPSYKQNFPENTPYNYLDFNNQKILWFFPSPEIQHQKIFIIDEFNGGSFHETRHVFKEENAIFCKMNLKQNGDVFEGNISYDFLGMSKLELWLFFKTIPDSLKDELTSEYLLNFAKNATISDLSYKNGFDTLNISGKISSFENIIIGKDRFYLNNNFVPFPHHLSFNLGTCKPFQVVAPNEMMNVFEITIDFEKSFKQNQSFRMERNQDGMEFLYYVEQVNSKQLRIRYYYKLNNILLNSSAVKNFNKLNKDIEYFIQKPLVLKYE